MVNMKLMEYGERYGLGTNGAWWKRKTSMEWATNEFWDKGKGPGTRATRVGHSKGEDKLIPWKDDDGDAERGNAVANECSGRKELEK
jgi:hypothetical protein